MKLLNLKIKGSDIKPFEIQTQIILNEVEDLISDCWIENVEIVAENGLNFLEPLILDPENSFEKLDGITKKPAPIISGCVFKNCTMPDAHYVDERIVQSSNQKVNSK